MILLGRRPSHGVKGLGLCSTGLHGHRHVGRFEAETGRKLDFGCRFWPWLVWNLLGLHYVEKRIEGEQVKGASGCGLSRVLNGCERVAGACDHAGETGKGPRCLLIHLH